VFNKDLLTRCSELHYKGKNTEPAPPPTIINKEEKYKVKEVWKHRKHEKVSQIRYLLVVIFKLNSVLGAQYKDVMMIDDGKY